MQRRFYPDEFKSDFEKFKEQLRSNQNIYILWTGKKILTKRMNIFLMFSINFKGKQRQIITT